MFHMTICKSVFVSAISIRVNENGNIPKQVILSKCKEVTQYNMARRCKCAGDFEHTLAVKDTVQLVDTFRGIALHYRMPLLMEQVDWILNMSPRLPKQLKTREGWPKN
jgi:hypothetical protein